MHISTAVIRRIASLLVALAVTPLISMAQAPSANETRVATATLTAMKISDTTLTVRGDSSYTFSYGASGSHHCNLVMRAGNNYVVTSGVVLDMLNVETVRRDDPQYPLSRFPTTIKLICYDIHGAVTISTKTLVVRRG